MAQNPKQHDIITEEEFNRRTARFSTTPGTDSRGDSEIDARLEIDMGLNYVPDGQYAPEEDQPELSMRTQPTQANDALEPIRQATNKKTEETLSENAKVISSELPSHHLDFNQESDTH